MTYSTWLLNFRAVATTNRRHCTNLCRATSSVWNFSGRISDVSRARERIARANREVLASLSLSQSKTTRSQRRHMPINCTCVRKVFDWLRKLESQQKDVKTFQCQSQLRNVAFLIPAIPGRKISHKSYFMIVVKLSPFFPCELLSITLFKFQNCSR